MQATAFQFDPFFDRAGAGTPQSNGPLVNPTIPGAGAQYLPADQSMMGLMRPSAVGLRGTIIPHATLGGIPIGTNPHETANVMVNIDPHIPNQSSTVRLGDLNAANILAASQAVHDITQLPDSDLVGLRIRGSATLHMLARGNQQMQAQQPQQAPIIPQPMNAMPAPQQYPQQFQPQQYQQPFQQQPEPQYQQPQPPMQPPRQPQPQQRQPVNSFFQQPQPRQPAPAQQGGMPPQMGGQAAPPTVQVAFEMEHFGRLSVNYHDVIIQPGFVVLVYDSRFNGGTKYFPPTSSGDTAPRTALNVIGTPDVYLVQTTGVQYTHGPYEYCVLMVEQSWPLTAE